MAHCAYRECGRWQPDLLVRGARVGIRVDGRWFCSQACVEATALGRLGETRQRAAPTAPRVPPLKLGVLLQHQRAIQPDDLRRALTDQRRSGLRLGQHLRQSGVISGTALLRALAAQASCSYLWFADVPASLPSPCGLSRDAVSALGLIPIAADETEQRIKVAATAPLPRAAIAGLRELTGWAVEAYLVSDEQWPALLAAYRGAEDRSSVALAIESLPAAAAHIARVASRSRTLQVTHARCDPFMWVRLAGPQVTEDLLVPVGELAEGASCPAASMRH